MKEKINISENGIVSIPSDVQMNIAEIASIFGTTQASYTEVYKTD